MSADHRFSILLHRIVCWAFVLRCFYYFRPLPRPRSDKENHLGQSDSPSTSPPSSDFPPAPQTTPGKRPFVTFPTNSWWGTTNQRPNQDEQGDDIVLEDRHPRLFLSPPARSQSEVPFNLSKSAHNKKSANLSIANTPPHGSSKLLRMHRSAIRQQQQAEELNLPSDDAATSWLSPPPVPSSTVGGYSSIGRSTVKRRLLGTGAKRVPVDSPPLRRAAITPFWKSPYRIPTRALDRNGYDGTSMTPSRQLLQSTNASRHQRIDAAMDDVVADVVAAPETTLRPALRSATCDEARVGPLLEGDGKQPSSAVPETLHPIRQVRRRQVHDPESSPPQPPCKSSTLYPSAHGTNDKTCDTPSSRGSLESFWEALPLCHRGGGGIHRHPINESQDADDSSSSSNAVTRLLRWECVTNPVALTLWKEAASAEASHRNEDIINVNMATMEDDDNDDDERNTSVASSASSVQLNSFAMDLNEHEHLPHVYSGERSESQTGNPSHPEPSLETPQPSISGSRSAVGMLPSDLPSPPKVTDNWHDLYGKGVGGPIIYPDEDTAMQQRVAYPSLVRPVAIIPSPSPFAAGASSEHQHHNYSHREL